MLGTHALFAFGSGLILGSFLNAWIYRIGIGKSILKGRSLCPKCSAQIIWYDNVPFVSFFVLQMRCRACKQPISWQYPIVELALGLLYLFAVFFHGGVTVAFARDAFVIFFLAFTFLSDFIYQRIFFSATLVPAFIVFGFALAVSPVGWQTLAIGVAVGGGFFLLQHLISRGTWIGVGDIFFGIFMGVILGWPLIIVALVLAYIIGALVAIPLLISKKRKLQSKIPFGTFLSVATFVTMFWGGRMLDWYLGLVL